jgi:hypothetical protein
VVNSSIDHRPLFLFNLPAKLCTLLAAYQRAPRKRLEPNRFGIPKLGEEKVSGTAYVSLGLLGYPTYFLINLEGQIDWNTAIGKQVQ